MIARCLQASQRGTSTRGAHEWLVKKQRLCIGVRGLCGSPTKQKGMYSVLLCKYIEYLGNSVVVTVDN